jgi:hypothetical protein
LKKFFITPLKQRIKSLFVKEKEAENWLSHRKIFFIIGFGRSGTSFLSNLLNSAQDACVFHEPVLEDYIAHLFAHYNDTMANIYIKSFRRKEIFSRMKYISPNAYGEVNGMLRCHAGAIKEYFPDAKILHLVRDGRDVVRSHMSRATRTLKNPLSMWIVPARSDPWSSRWVEMDRFARICWSWQEENRRLRLNIGKTIHFEKIISSYEYFASEVLVPCGIHIEKSVWAAAVNKPRNTTSEFSMPKWDKWTPEQQKTFREICGDEMSACGYEF